jgi:hypothetical protein
MHGNVPRARPRALRTLAVLTAACGLALMPTLAAQAHVEEQTGAFDYEIGFGTEPAYAGQPNSVQLIFNKGGKPVVNLTDQLKVEVSFGGQSTTLSFEPNFEVGGDGDPGDYRAWFVPSQAGKYTFHLTGTFEGQKFDVTATSGPTTFASVQELSSVAFPPVTAPTNEELATKIDQEATRTQDAVTAAQTAATSANDAAKTAKTVGIVGVLLGAIGLIVAVVALTRKRA